MKEYNGMFGKELRDWRIANRRHFSEHTMMQATIRNLKSLGDDDKQKILDVVNECFSKKKEY